LTDGHSTCAVQMSITSHPSGPGISVTPVGTSRRHAAAHAVRIRLARAYLRPSAHWRGAELDRQLAAGVSPQLTAVLALGAENDHFATQPRGAGRRPRSSPQRRPPHASGLHCRRAPSRPRADRGERRDQGLSGCLRSPEPVDAQGIAILRRLLTDAGSALYRTAHHRAPSRSASYSGCNTLTLVEELH
jgi:hypothetical protein